MDNYYLSEKTNPRKRLKGRRGCKGGGKGSQRKRTRKDRHFNNPELIYKDQNIYFEHESFEDEVDPNIFKDDFGNNIGYSLNKKKRWKLREKYEKRGGLCEDEGVKNDFEYYEKKMDELVLMREEEFEKERNGRETKSDRIYCQYEEAKKEKRKSGKKKKNKLKKNRERNRYYNEYWRRRRMWWPQRVELFNRVKNQRKRQHSDEKKRVTRLRNEEFSQLHKEIKTMEKKLEKKRKKMKGKQKYAGRREEDKRERIVTREEEMIRKIRSNPDRYTFETMESDKLSHLRSYGDKYSERRERKSSKRRNRRKRKTGAKNYVTSNLRNKSTVLKMYK